MNSIVYVPATAERIAGPRRRAPKTTELDALAAVHRQLHTKRHAMLALANNGFTSTPAVVDALMERNTQHGRARAGRANRRICQRLGHLPARVADKPSGRPPVTLPAGTPAQRLESLRVREIKATARSHLRHGAAGGTSYTVVLTRDPAKVNYSVEMSSNRDTYGGRYKGWLAAEDHHRICVPADWRVRVQRRGLAVAGGMFTLDLQQLTPAGDVELYRAVWVAQSRGYSVKVHRGVMAVLGDEVFHADNVEAALRGLRLKVARAQRTPQSMAERYAQNLDAFVARYRRHGALPVRVDDARAIGACEYGIQAWCEAVGIDLDEGEVTLERMLVAYRAHPLVEARRTILHVLAQFREAKRSGPMRERHPGELVRTEAGT